MAINTRIPHCSNCGRENPQLREGTSYTVCCNEPVCGGEQNYYSLPKWGNKNGTVSACCGAAADEAWKATYGKLESFGRLFD